MEEHETSTTRAMGMTTTGRFSEDPPYSSIKPSRGSHKLNNYSFIDPGTSPFPIANLENPSSVSLIKMRREMNEKDNIITAHRKLICQLYRHIEGQNQNTTLLKNIIAVLKETLIRNNITLPDICGKVSTTTHHNEYFETDPLKAAAMITNFTELQVKSLNEYEEFFKNQLLPQHREKSMPRPTQSSGIVKRSKIRRQDGFRIQRPKVRANRTAGGYHSNENYGRREYSNPRGLSTTYCQGYVSGSPGGGAERMDTITPRVQTTRQKTVVNKLRNLLQAGDLISDIIEANLRGEEMVVMSKFMLSESAKDMFKERVRVMVYRIVGLFFHLRSYANSPKRPDDHLANIIDILATLLDCERCLMYIYDQNTKTLQTKAVRGPRIDCFSISPDRGIIGAVYTSRNGVMLRSPYEDPRFDRSLDQNRKSITRNMVCVPLKSAGNCVGCLEIANKRGAAFTEQDYQLVASVAKELATGLLSQQLKGGFAKEKVEFKERVGQIASENLLTPLLKNVLIILAEVLKCEKVLLYIKSGSEDTVLLSEVSSVGITAGSTPVELDIGGGCAGLAFRTKEPIFEPFAQSSQTLSKQEVDPAVVGTTVHSVVAVPIFDEAGDSIGVFEALNCDKAVFSTGSTKPLLIKFAKYVSLLFYTNGLLKNTLESYEVLSVALDNVNEGSLIVDHTQCVTMCNISARLLLGLTEEETIGWKVTDLFRENEHLLEVYYNVLEGRETQQQMLNTVLVTRNGRNKEKLTINFRCIAISTTKGGSGDILILLQPIPV